MATKELTMRDRVQQELEKGSSEDLDVITSNVAADLWDHASSDEAKLALYEEALSHYVGQAYNSYRTRLRFQLEKDNNNGNGNGNGGSGKNKQNKHQKNNGGDDFWKRNSEDAVWNVRFSNGKEMIMVRDITVPNGKEIVAYLATREAALAEASKTAGISKDAIQDLVDEIEAKDVDTAFELGFDTVARIVAPARQGAE